MPDESQNAEKIPATDEEIDASAGGCVAALSPFAPRTDDERKMARWVLRLIARVREYQNEIHYKSLKIERLECREIELSSQLAALRPVSNPALSEVGWIPVRDATGTVDDFYGEGEELGKLTDGWSWRRAERRTFVLPPLPKD